jgi:hypothetical protein
MSCQMLVFLALKELLEERKPQAPRLETDGLKS